MPRGAAPGERRGGRQKGTPNKITADIKALAQVHGQAAIDTLVGIMSDVEAHPASRVAAAKEIIDRGYGKAVQAVEHSGLDGADLSLSVIFRKADE